MQGAGPAHGTGILTSVCSSALFWYNNRVTLLLVSSFLPRPGAPQPVSPRPLHPGSLPPSGAGGSGPGEMVQEGLGKALADRQGQLRPTKASDWGSKCPLHASDLWFPVAEWGWGHCTQEAAAV